MKVNQAGHRVEAVVFELVVSRNFIIVNYLKLKVLTLLIIDSNSSFVAKNLWILVLWVLWKFELKQNFILE